MDHFDDKPATRSSSETAMVESTLGELQDHFTQIKKDYGINKQRVFPTFFKLIRIYRNFFKSVKLIRFA